MFTGLIEAIGEVVEVKGISSGMRLRIQTSLANEVKPGDSLAVNGVCLTVILAENGEVHADVGPETARVTSLGLLRRAQLVNLERAMRADSRVGDGRGRHGQHQEPEAIAPEHPHDTSRQDCTTMPPAPPDDPL